MDDNSVNLFVKMGIKIAVTYCLGMCPHNTNSPLNSGCLKNFVEIHFAAILQFRQFRDDVKNDFQIYN